MKFTDLTRFVLCVIAAIIACGCGSDAVDYGPTGTVKGSVKIGDKTPSEGTQVTFLQPTEGYSATGYTDANGNYTVASWNNGNLPAGDYKVFVMPPEPKPLTPEEELDRKPGENEPVSEFDAKFSDAETSGLTYTVKEGENTYDVKLTP